MIQIVGWPMVHQQVSTEATEGKTPKSASLLHAASEDQLTWSQMGAKSDSSHAF